MRLSGSGGVSKELSETELQGWAEVLQSWPPGGHRPRQLASLVIAGVSEALKEMCDKLKVLLTVPKTSVKLVEKTMKGWNRDKNTLPEDLHYSGHELVRLNTVDRMVIQNKTNTDQGTRVEVEDYNYENAADKEGFCPDLDDQDAYGDAVEDDMDTMTQTLANDTGDQEVPDITMGGELYTGDNLVAAPKLVDKAALQIG